MNPAIHIIKTLMMAVMFIGAASVLMGGTKHHLKLLFIAFITGCELFRFYIIPGMPVILLTGLLLFLFCKANKLHNTYAVLFTALTLIIIFNMQHAAGITYYLLIGASVVQRASLVEIFLADALSAFYAIACAYIIIPLKTAYKKARNYSFIIIVMAIAAYMLDGLAVYIQSMPILASFAGLVIGSLYAFCAVAGCLAVYIGFELKSEYELQLKIDAVHSDKFKELGQIIDEMLTDKHNSKHSVRVLVELLMAGDMKAVEQFYYNTYLRNAPIPYKPNTAGPPARQ